MPNIYILGVLDLDDVNVNTLYSATKIYFSEDILIPGLRLLGIIQTWRADPPKSLYMGTECRCVHLGAVFVTVGHRMFPDITVILSKH